MRFLFNKTGLTFVLLPWSLGLLAQTPSFNHQKLGSEEGLNNANIFNIEQHPNGLMYFTTQNGIYHYDGYNFSKLRMDGIKGNALQGVSIKSASELWLSIRDEGMAVYEMQSGKVRMQPGIPFKENCDYFMLDEEFGYFLNSGTELNVVNVKAGTLVKDEVRKKDKANIAYCIFKTSGKKVLVGRSDGLYEMKGTAQVKLDYVRNLPVYAIAESKEGKLYLGSTGSIIIINNGVVETEITPKYSGKSSTFLPGGIRNIEKILVDDHGRVWFTAFPGENLYLYQNKKVHDVFENLDISPSLINCIYRDREQNLWVGTFNDGVYFIQNPHFNSFNFTFDRKVLNVNSVFLKNNLLAAGTSNGLFCMNLNTNESKIVSRPDPILNEPIGSINEVGNVLYFSSRSEVPATAFADARHMYKFKSISAAQFYPIDADRTVVADRLATVLLYNSNATKLLDTLISFTNYRISINDILRSGDSLLVATGSGLYYYSFSNKKYVQLDRPDLNFIINDVAWVNGELYAAHESGITPVNKAGLRQKLGELNLNSVKKIKQFNDKIWRATLDGVYICDRNWQPVKVINKTNGLLSNSISDIVFNNETVCIATARGVAVANINSILSGDARMRPVSINTIRTNDDTLVYSGNVLNLGREQENLSISFYSPQFSKPNKQLYRYRIDNGEWSFANDNSIAVSISSGGLHSIDISVSLDRINWSNNTTLQFNKEARITESNWTYLVITLAGLTVIMLISFMVVKRVKAAAMRRLQEEKQVNQLKHQAMNSLLSPHFIFNSLTSIQNYINTNNSLKASEYLAKFSRLIRMIIEKASQSEITLNDEISRLSYYLELEKERFKNKFDFNIEVDDNLNRAEIKIPNMIIQPHAENCIIHGILPKMEHGMLEIRFRKSEQNKLIITIEDDGIGLIKAKEHAKTGHKSLGTATIRSILEINSKLNGKSQSVSMIDKSELDPPRQGTLITIELEL